VSGIVSAEAAAREPAPHGDREQLKHNPRTGGTVFVRHAIPPVSPIVIV